MLTIPVVLIAIVGSTCAFQDITVVEWLRQNGFHTMMTLLHTSGLDTELSSAGSFTILAPTEAAFLNLGSQLASIKSNPTELRRILQYHVTREFILVPLITGYKSVGTLLNGEDITFHRISNTEALVNNGTRMIQTSNNLCNNGVVNPIDTVLFPPIIESLNIAQILIRDESKYLDFSLGCLVTGLLSVLENGEFTLFVPDKSAFAWFSKIMMDPNLPRETVQQGTEFMKNYIVPGARDLGMLKKTHQLFTLHGSKVNVTTSTNGDVLINHARIVESDIKASNGIIHLVDRMIPPRDMIEAVYQNFTEYIHDML